MSSRVINLVACFFYPHRVCYPRIINPLLIALSHDEIGPLSRGGNFFAKEKGSGGLPKQRRVTDKGWFAFFFKGLWGWLCEHSQGRGPVNTTVSLVTIPRDCATLEEISWNFGTFFWGSKRELYLNEEIPNHNCIFESILISSVVKQILNIKKYVRIICQSYPTNDSLLIIIDISCLLYILSYRHFSFFLYFAYLSILEVILIRRALFFSEI